MLTGKKILVGVTGGIAAYKAAYLVRRLRQAGVEVRVVMTKSATQFITPLTMETLSERPVGIEMFPEREFVGTHHITLADWPELVVVAPCTANVIGKVAGGLADDLLTNVLIATRAPVLLVPAMHDGMWANPQVQKNIVRLKEEGVHVLDPDIGPLASGDFGPGRLPEVEVILARIEELVGGQGPLKGKKVLVTAGRTEEPLDPVRYLSNRSSGRMGIALAEAARDTGANVTLVHGPVSIALPAGVTSVSVSSAQEMYAMVADRFDACDVLLMAAAVADYAPEKPVAHKLKKTKKTLTVTLAPTVDILAEMGREKDKQILVGFALETEQEVKQAREKLQAKNVDLMVVNNPLEPGAGFEVETNRVTLLFRDGETVPLPLLRKRQVADRIVAEVVNLLKARERKSTQWPKRETRPTYSD